MTLEAALVLRYGIEHAGHTVAYIVAYHIAHIQRRDYHTYCRKKYVEVVSALEIDSRSEHRGDIMDEKLQHQGSEATENTYDKCKYYHEVLFADVLLTPQKKGKENLSDASGCCIVFQCVYCHT